MVKINIQTEGSLFITYLVWIKESIGHLIINHCDGKVDG